MAAGDNALLASDQWYRFRWMAEKGHYEFLKKADKCDNFFVGNQWHQSDLNILELQRRPAMTINKIISTLSTIMGEQIYNRSEVLYRPANGAPVETAEALSKLWLQIAHNNQLPWVRSDVFADGIIRSRGFYDMRMDFDDSMRGEIRITQLNSKNVLIDPDAEEYDPDSWNDVIISKWLTAQDISILYSPDAAKELQGRAGSVFMFGYDSIDIVRDRIGGAYTEGFDTIIDKDGVRRNHRVIERQYHKLDSMKHFVDKATGDMRVVPEDWDRDKIASVLARAKDSLAVVKKPVKRIRWTVTSDNLVLHDSWSPYKHFTTVPYFPHFLHGRTVGIVENLLGPQEILNKTSSQELHIVNTTANSGWKVRAGALKNMSIEELEQNGATTGLVLELDDVTAAEKILPNQTPNGLDRISYKAEEHIKTISNVSDSMQGFDREDVAAKAIAYKQQRGSVNLTKVLDNLERTDYLLARNALDLIQTYYTEHRILNITHDDILKEPETLEINQYDEATNTIVNDLTIGEYDIVITSTPYRASMEDSQFEQARALREIGVPIPDKVLIENSRLMRRSDIIKEMSAASESPEAQAAAALEQRAREAEVASLEADAENKRADAQLKLAKSQTEGGDAELVKIQADAALKRQQMELDHKLELERLERDTQLKREVAMEELKIKREQAAEMNRLQRIQAMNTPTPQPKGE